MLISNLGFTTSVFLAVAITAVFAVVFETTFEMVVSMLVVGVLTSLYGSTTMR